jgi:signal transduction histidine kinase/putative methionine-R-sulfoxide reductase with GAF domain
VSPRGAGRRPNGLESVLGAIARTAARLCEATDALIHLVDGDHHRLVAKHGRLAHFQRLGDTHAIRRDTPLGLAVLEGRPVHVHDVRAAARTRFRGLVQLRLLNPRIRTLLVMPLLRDGSTLGGIVIRRARVQPFTTKQVALLRAFADQAAITIENARLAQSLGDRNRELTEALEQQTATSEILRVISSSPGDLAPVFETILANGIRLCEAQRGMLMTYDGDVFWTVAHRGLNPEALAYFLIPGRPGPLTGLGRMQRERQPVHIPDILDDPAYAAGDPERLTTARLLGARTVLWVPIIHGTTLVGALVIYREEVRPFTGGQLALLQTFADQAVIAIESVRLFTELQARNRALSEALEQQTATSAILRAISGSPTDIEPVLDEIAEHAARLCDALFAAVYRFDGALLHLGAHHNYPPAALERSRQFFPAAPTRRFFSGRAILDRAVVHVPDTAQDHEVVQDFLREADFHSVLCVPMLREGAPAGVITVWRATVGPFSDRQVALLETFADQGVIALENVRLFTALQARNQELTDALDRQTATAEILSVISRSQTDVRPVFEAIADSAMRLFRAWSVTVYRFDGEQLHLGAARGGQPGSDEKLRANYPRSPRAGGVIGPAILKRAVHHVVDAQAADQDPRTVEFARVRGYRTAFTAPMLRDGAPVGAIGVTRAEVRPFSEAEIDLLRTFADQAVIAIENARLFSELQQRTAELGRSVEQLQALSEVGQAVSSTLDLEAVLQAIVTRAAQLAGTRGCSIWEYDERAEVFSLRATTILDPEIEKILRSAGLRKGEGSIGRAAFTRAPVQIPDVSAAGAYEGPLRDALVRAGGGSVLALPFLHEDRLLGGLTVSRRATGEFPPDAVALLSTFAAQSAIALQNARLYRELEAKSRELEVASRHKSQFLANMSHELRTPLNAILGYGEMMADGIYGDLPETVRDVLGRVDASGRHLLGLINDVLDLSKIEAGQLALTMTEYSMEEVVQSVVASVEALATAKNLVLAVDLAPDLPPGRGDQRRLAQVVLNLVANAIKFTEQGGVGVQVTAPGAAFEVSVRDTGPGIAPADQERIFQEFQQADTATTRPKGGTGLGLAIARRIVAMHGGRLWVESIPGEGATFRFTVPVQVERQAAVGGGGAG